MKKLLTLLVMLIGITTLSFAGDTYARDASVLPPAAKSVLEKNFKSKVSVVKIEKKLGRVDEYEVILTDGTEITFDRNGNWDNVETSANKNVPDFFIPKGVSDYINKNHRGVNIVGIDKERGGYDVELANGIEMKFNKEGKFLRYDD